MPRNSIFDTTENILKLLKKKEYTVNQIADELKIQWKTAIKSLDFLKRLGLVKERKGNKTYKEERLFSLRK